MSKATVLTNDLLKGVMTDALVSRSYCEDMNECKTSGYYIISEQRTVNIPEGAYHYGVLMVMQIGSFILQVYYPHIIMTDAERGCIYTRLHHTNSGWGVWMKVFGSPVLPT